MAKKTENLIQSVKDILRRLADGGWHKVFLQHELNILSDNLEEELSKTLTINRRAPGFSDFAINGIRGIEAGKPALSLLFHGFSSPNVITYVDGSCEKKISIFPTGADLDIIENLVYGLNTPSIQDIQKAANGSPLAIVVFAKEYRVGIGTPHQRHADMTYSRTGISRVGTAEAKYIDSMRGYTPENKDEPTKIRVLPCRYSAYIATLVNGEAETHGPMRFKKPNSSSGEVPNKIAGLNRNTQGPDGQAEDKEPGDANRRFWIPLHKLFSGKECISGYDLSVKLKSKHINEKLRRIHIQFGQLGHYGGWSEPEISAPPFVFEKGIAEFSHEASDGEGLIVPCLQPSLVGFAKNEKGEQVTYVVPDSNKIDTSVYSSSLNIGPLETNARPAPEYVHARFAVDYNDEGEVDLNTKPNVKEIVARGGYRAKHMIDYTGDGYIDVECTQLNLDIPTRLPAFSVVAPPDYYYKVKQTQLMQWWSQSSPHSIKKTIWPQNPGEPEALSDQRIPGNLELEGGLFSDSDDTITAIVSQFKLNGGDNTRLSPPHSYRNSMLPDSASGVFAPGWDVSVDQKLNEDGVTIFFSTRGLGSPFPEDAKLCAALSSFWPAAAPDITRTFAPSNYATATPLFDETIGQDEAEPWDGIRGPRIIDEKNSIIEFNHIDYGDYVKAALDDAFNTQAIADIDPREYIARTTAMARVYQALDAQETRDKTKYAVYSFTRIDSEDPEWIEASRVTGSNLSDEYGYRFMIYEPGDRIMPSECKDAPEFDKVWVKYTNMQTIFADSKAAFMKNDKGEWIAKCYRD